MSPSGQKRDWPVRTAARVGYFASAGVVFACGWFAMQSEDWKRVALFSVLALGAGLVAAAFHRVSRS